LGIATPTDELIFFRGVGLNHQPEELYRIGGYENEKDVDA
jgi:hypothetical protein